MASEELDALKAAGAKLRAEISVLHRALMRRVQEDNCCTITGIDCNVRGGGRLCSCSLEAKGELEHAYDPPEP